MATIPEFYPPEYWTQPDPEAVAIDGRIAIMDQAAFDLLQDYARNRDYIAKREPGMMWRLRFRDRWWLYWIGEDRSVNHREIEIA